MIRHLAIDANGVAVWGLTVDLELMIDARAGYVFHNGGARVMGSAQALPERIDKDTAERVAGRHFCSTDFDALATQTPGFISREQLLEAARVRNLSFTLREKSQKKFDFGFVAEEKEDA